MHRISLNAGFCSRLCLNLYNFSETAVSQLNGRRPDRRQVQASYTSYAWLLLIQCHVHSDSRGLGLILPVSYIIYLYSHTSKEF
jgi:hypothetical protein